MKTIIKISTLTFSTIILSCQSNSKECKPYFQYDQIEYYSIDIDENDVWDLEESQQTSEEKTLMNILSEELLSKLSDTIVLSDIEKLGFTKTEIPRPPFQ